MYQVSSMVKVSTEHTVISVFNVVKRYVSPSIAWLLLKIILWVCWWWTWWEWDMNQEVFSVSLFVLLLVFRHIYTTLSFTILLLWRVVCSPIKVGGCCSLTGSLVSLSHISLIFILINITTAAIYYLHPLHTSLGCCCLLLFPLHLWICLYLIGLPIFSLVAKSVAEICHATSI